MIIADLVGTRKASPIGYNMEDITQIIKDIVSRIDTTILGKFNVLSNETDYCFTKWARPGKIVKDEIENEYLITGIVPGKSLTVIQQNTPLTDLTGTTFLNAPYFQTGTKLAANAEWTKSLNDLTKKTPLIWLLEIIREDRFSREDVREFETDLRIFFLDETDPTQYLTEDHRREVVVPMSNLCESFLDVIREDRTFKRLEKYRVTTFSRFGVENENGVIQNILDANLSGVELQLTLSKYKSNCKC